MGATWWSTYTFNKTFFLVSIVGPADTLETGGGACTDSFVASGTSGLTSPVICGLNAGQHSK